MSLSRFQLSNDAADVADSKNLSVVIAFNATGVFNVVCKVEDFKYSVYYACPLRPKGRPCGRKLSDDNTCGGCGVKTTEPLQNLLVRLVLQDIEQPQILQQATMFSAMAEHTILTKQLEEKLGLELNVKINIKEWPSGDDLRPREEQIGGGPEGLERQEADVGNDKEPIFRESSHHVHRIERFALSRYVTEFTLNANSEEPDETLRNAFDQLINRAIQNAESGGRKVAKLGIWLMGKGLNEPILLPARSPDQNNADVLMAELEKLGQSDADEERDGGMDKRTLLLSEPIQIIVTCLTPPTGAAPRFHPLRELAEELLRDAEIPDDLDAYGMEHLDQVQKLWLAPYTHVLKKMA
uniref:HECT domain-containing protein n=1 Tax=Globodera pallida TaxID=36090 RepID=A0A183C3C6_GLOPA